MNFDENRKIDSGFSFCPLIILIRLIVQQIKGQITMIHIMGFWFVGFFTSKTFSYVSSYLNLSLQTVKSQVKQSTGNLASVWQSL